MNDEQSHVMLLQSLLRLDQPVDHLETAVGRLPWDSDRSLVTLTGADAASILERFARGELSASDVERWANAVEGREDIDFDEGHESELREALFELANPLLTEPLTPARAAQWVARLR